MTSSIGNVVSLAARAGGNVVRQVRSAIDPSAARPAGAGQPASGWLVVTVFCAASDIDAAALPPPLAELGDRIEVRVRPAAGDKGTELAARLCDRAPSGSAASRLSGRDPRAELRSALRSAKQLIEVTHVMPLEDGPQGYRMFKEKEDGCVRAVFRPGG
ncbi:hypothetical protein I4I84_07675 [Pseudonocardia sp. KRD-182]|uniref:hypothetical protein n=1 Tax=Pseudonocardia oceani TaxID=2792013 RepID=UPI001C4A3D81|nr:hypothetical protein [Pseudonocardia oceani]MBW0108602.1 hypothetical protein [Pseudonocardia oceani]